MEKSLDHWVSQAVDHSLDHSVNHSLDHAVDHSLDHAVDQSVDQSKVISIPLRVWMIWVWPCSKLNSPCNHPVTSCPTPTTIWSKSKLPSSKPVKSCSIPPAIWPNKPPPKPDKITSRSPKICPEPIVPCSNSLKIPSILESKPPKLKPLPT